MWGLERIYKRFIRNLRAQVCNRVGQTLKSGDTGGCHGYDDNDDGAVRSRRCVLRTLPGRIVQGMQNPPDLQSGASAV